MTKFDPKSQKMQFDFTAPEAKSVQLIGDFNEWTADAHPMKKGRNGVWKVGVELPEGEYEFRYLVDGEVWKNDETSTQIPNLFGSHNSLVVVTLD